MAVNRQKARDFVYSSGALWERTLFGWLFEDRPLAQWHQALLAHKNPDNGWGHALEHDVRTPDSNPIALEFLLTVLRVTGAPAGNLLDGTPGWVEANRRPDGTLQPPPSLFDYPHGPWWDELGLAPPADSIVGNLTRLKLSTPSLDETTRQWVQANVTLDTIRANEWLFMAYHAADYFLGVNDFPDLDRYRAATIQNIADCATRMPERQYYALLQFAPSPDTVLARALPPSLIERSLDYVAATQRDDGGWNDEHNLPQWFAWVTITNLLALRNYGRI